MYKEHIVKKIYYTIGELAEMMEIETSCIRFWENEFSWIVPGWNKKGHRLYTIKQANEVLKIHFLIKKCKKRLPGLKQAKRLGFYKAMISFYEHSYKTKCPQL